MIIDEATTLAIELKRNELFAQCADGALELLCGAALEREARRGTQIALSGSPFPYLGFVRDGAVAVTAEADGEIRGGVRRLTIYEAYAGETFGAVALLDGQIPVGEIGVVSKIARYALFPQIAVAQAAQLDPTLFRRLAAQAASRYRSLTSRLLIQAAYSVGSRVANVLLPFASEKPGLQPVDRQLMEFSQRDLAAAAGCVKEAAARAIAEMEHAGALKREHGRIAYIDREQLLRYGKTT